MTAPKPLNHFERNRSLIMFDPDEDRTKQEHKKECDINHIMAKFQKTGLLNHVSKYAPRYGDMPSAEELEHAKFQIAEANSMFQELPSSIRKRFSGPEEYLNFVTDKKNRKELQEMGLLPKEADDASADASGDETSKPKGEQAQNSAKTTDDDKKGDQEANKPPVT